MQYNTGQRKEHLFGEIADIYLTIKLGLVLHIVMFSLNNFLRTGFLGSILLGEEDGNQQHSRIGRKWWRQQHRAAAEDQPTGRHAALSQASLAKIWRSGAEDMLAGPRRGAEEQTD